MATRKSSMSVSNKAETTDREKDVEILTLIRQDLRDVKERLDKTVRSDELEKTVTITVQNLLIEFKNDT